MPGDRSRRSDLPRHGYTGVVAQQGRVILDRDFNASQALTAARIASDALDEIGPCGTPDDGFRIAAPNPWSASPPLWSPPVTPPATSPPISVGGHNDFSIAPGTMYIGGQRVEFPAEQNGVPITYSYFAQPDWLTPAQLRERVPLHELVFLRVTEQEISAVEDPDLLEVALGGPDTTQRLKLMRRVRRLAVASPDCATAWQTAVDGWLASGLRFDPATMRLLPAMRLQVGFTEDVTVPNPCDPVTTGGYLGPDNQLIRVRIDTSGGSPQLIWGYDNASFMYRATVDPSDHSQLTLAGGPPDSFHFPIVNQVVEILGTAAVLGTIPDDTDGASIDRVAAAANGRIYTLNQAFGPTPANPTTNVLVLPAPLPDHLVNNLPLFVRVWQSSTPIDATGGTYPLVDAAGNSTGLAVTISVPAGTPLAHGVFWQIAARPSTPQGVYPEELLTAPQPPDGPREWACPLAVINWTVDGQSPVTDCRIPFDNLVALSRRAPGCCTVAIAPSDVTETTTLQTLINRAAAKADKVTVCLAAGTYALPRLLRLTAGHAGLTLESCGPAVLEADPKADPALFTEGLLVVTEVNGVTLRGLTLEPPVAPVPLKTVDALLSRLPANLAAQGGAALGRPTASFGVHVFDAGQLTIENCTIQFPAPSVDATTDLFAAAVFLQGACQGLVVRDCRLLSPIVPTYTPMTVDAATAAPRALAVFNRAIESLHVALSLTSPPAAVAPAGEMVALTGNQITTGFSALVATRAAAPFAARRPGVIATVGVLAVGSISGASSDELVTMPCELGVASVRDTVFSGFTFATWFSAGAATLRIQDNTVTGGVAGLWLEVPGAIPPVAPNIEKPQYYPQIMDFEEFQILRTLAVVFPPPGTTTKAVAVAEGFDLYIDGNQVRSRTSGASTAALLLALNGPPVKDNIQVRDQTAIVSDNQFRTAAGNAEPAALLTLPSSLPCAITGNLILNIALTNSRQIFGPSLTVEVDHYGDGTELLSITGNVLKGSSDLMRGEAALNLMRRTVPPANNWHLYNADPS